MINSDIKIPKPDQYYGAVYGRNNHNQAWLYVCFCSSLILWLGSFMILYSTADRKNSGSVALNFGIVIILLLIPSILAAFTFNHNSHNFKKDIYQGRINYAHTQFKTWVEQNYGLQITEDQALQLMNGNTIPVRLADKKEKLIRLNNNEEMSNLFKIGTANFAEFKQAKTWDYDTDKLDIQIIISKQQKPVKEKTLNRVN